MKNDLLRKARINHGWTQERLAQELDVGEDTIRAWESGRRNPGIAMRNRLCEILGKTATELGLPSPESGLPTVPLNGILDTSEQDAPQPINDILETFEQDAPQPTFKKKKTLGGGAKIIAALVSILTIVILITYFMVPGLSLSSTGKGAAPSPTPRTGALSSGSPTPTIEPTPTVGPTPTIEPTPTVGPTPTIGSTPTIGPTPTGVANSEQLTLIQYLGPLNFQGYCQASGNTGAVLYDNNSSGWRCITSSGARLIVNTDTACQWQYKQSDVLSRMVNFFDPNDWHCYGHVQKLGGVNFAEYCQSLGLQAHLSGLLVYDWRCSASSADNGGQLIDVNKACLWQYKGYEAIASVTDYFDANGWTCIGTYRG